jgi:hypothetical protein
MALALVHLNRVLLVRLHHHQRPCGSSHIATRWDGWNLNTRRLTGALSGTPFLGAPSSTPFLGAPSGTSFLGAPFGTPFPGAPSGTPFQEPLRCNISKIVALANASDAEGLSRPLRYGQDRILSHRTEFCQSLQALGHLLERKRSLYANWTARKA